MHQEYLEKEKKKLDSINRCTTSIRLRNTCRQFLWKKKKNEFLIIFIIIIFFIKLYQNLNKMVN